MVARMNLDHTVRDLRNFINAWVSPRFLCSPFALMMPHISSRPENNARPYTIGTTFPNRTLDDDSITIEAAGLRNSVIVQRWA